MTTPVQWDLNAYYEGKSTREMIEDVRRWLGVNATDTNRYSDTDVVRALNMGQERFAKLTGCISYPAVVCLKASRQHYRLPYNALTIKSARYYNSTTATDYFELQIINSSKKVQRIDSQMRGTTGTPDFLFPSYRGGNVLWFGLSPIPSSNGATWDADDYGVLTTATGYTLVGNISGFHKDGFASSAFLVDSAGRNLSTLGATVGYPLFNTTDDSSTIITAIGNQDATNDKVAGTLAGGTDNDWDPGDAFLIPMAEYGVVLDMTSDETYTISSYLGTIFDITGGQGNLILDIARKPLELSATLDEFRSELPAAYHEAPIAFAVYWLGRGAYKGVTQSNKALEGMTVFNNYVQEYFKPDEFTEESESEVEDRGHEWY